jgi:uncharacterized membrane protein YhaH (DUF805 family)
MPSHMRFEEINILGVYVSPISILIVFAWLLTLGIRRLADRFGLLRFVWHPAMFVFSIYMILLSSIVLLFAHC